MFWPFWTNCFSAPCFSIKQQFKELVQIKFWLKYFSKNIILTYKAQYKARFFFVLKHSERDWPIKFEFGFRFNLKLLALLLL